MPARGPALVDTSFLRRRMPPAQATAPVELAPVELAPVEVAAPAQARTSEASAPASLSLSPRSDVTPATPAAAEAAPPRPRAKLVPRLPAPFPAPGIREVRQLGPLSPVVRLDARQSAMGSLIVSGCTALAWESTTRVTGSATADGETSGPPLMTAGNRPLVGFDEADALVSLRHVAELRRALFIGRGSTLGVELFDRATLGLSGEDQDDADSRAMLVLSVLRVGNLLELRGEPVGRELDDAAIFGQFGFAMTPYVASRVSRGR